MQNRRVLISGAGIAGLTLAYWLKEYGFIPTLVERYPELPTGGYKVDIRGVACTVLRRMEAYDPILSVKTAIRGATLIDGANHSREIEADLCGGRTAGDLEVMRGDLCRVLFERVGECECLFGESITHLSQTKEGVSVAFEKNAPRQFDLVIGADGLHSTVRKLIFGDESHFLRELGFYISVYTVPNFLDLDRWEIEYFEPQKFVNVYSAKEDLQAKAGFAFASKPLQWDRQNRETCQEHLKRAFASTSWKEVPRLLSAMEASPDFYFDTAAQTIMPHWAKERVVLVGDAAFAPSPLSGQGTSVAIVGSYVLAGELAAASGNYQKAFAQYEQELRHFVTRNQQLAQMNVTLMGEKELSWKAWLGQHLLRSLPVSIIHFFKRWGTKRITTAANALKLKDYSLELR